MTTLRHACTLILTAAVLAPRADGTELETVVVTATRGAGEAGTLPASLSTVAAPELELIGAVHISEALSRVPGTWISRGNGQENLTAIRSPVFTGAGSCGAFYLGEDGVPIRPSGFCNVNALAEVNGEQAERIEVLRGPGTAVHGANAQHGVINVITRAAPRDGTERAIALEAGANDYTRLLGRLGAGDASQGWLLTVNAAHDDGYKRSSGYEQQKLGLRNDLDWDGGSFSSRYSFVNLEQDTAGFVIGEGTYRRSDTKRENPNPQSFRDNRVHRWSGDLRIDGPADSAFSLTPYLRHQEMRFLQHFLLGEPVEENGVEAAGLQAGWSMPMGADSLLRAGLDGELAEGWLKETQALPVPGISSLPAGKHYDYRVDSGMSAAFSQIEWQALPGTRVLAGLRLERQSYDYDNRMIDGATRDDGSPCGAPGRPSPCRYSRPADSQDSFTEWSWNAGLVHALGADQDIVLNAGRGFRPPQTAELYRLQAGQVSTEIAPEQIDSVEAGIRGSRGPADYSLVAFAMEKREVIYQDADRRNVSGARTRHQGIEYSVGLRLGADWRLDADGTLAQHRYDSADVLQGLPPGTDIKGNDIDTAPRSFASVRLSWDASPHTRAELEWQHMGRYFLEPTESFDYPGHDLLHLRVRHEIAQGWSLTARISNLLDEDYAERADYAFGDYRYFVGEPRELFLEIAWEQP